MPASCHGYVGEATGCMSNCIGSVRYVCKFKVDSPVCSACSRINSRADNVGAEGAVIVTFTPVPEVQLPTVIVKLL